jgi:hypothetical protein
VKGVKVTNHWNSSVAKIQNDGIDMLSNAHSHVSRCFVLTQDDAMCLKGAFYSSSSAFASAAASAAASSFSSSASDASSSSPTDKNKKNDNKNNKNNNNNSNNNNNNKFGYPTEMTNVTFSQNTVYTSCAGAKYGMQARAAMSNSAFVDHHIVHCRRAIVVEATEGNSPMTNLLFERVHVDEVAPTLSYDPHPIQIDTKCNAIRNVTVKDVTFHQAAGYRSSGSSPLEGKSATYNIDGIRFIGIRYAGQPAIMTAEDGDIEVGKYVTGVTFKAT